MANKTKDFINIISSAVSVIIIIIVLILGIIINTKLSQVEYSYSTYFGNNWQSGMVNTFSYEVSNSCPVGDSYAISNSFFPGFKAGCYCGNEKYYPEQCDQQQTNKGCKNFKESTPKQLVSWRGTLCAKKTNTTYFDINRTDSTNRTSTCTEGLKECGIADNMNTKLCIPKNETCNIANSIKFENQQRQDNKSNKTISSKKLVYGYGNTNDGKIISELFIFDHKPCADSLENKITLAPGDGPYQCKVINGNIYNPYYDLVDTMTIEELALYNHLTTQLQDYPFWDQIKNKVVGLYSRNYIAMNNACFQIGKESYNPLSLIANNFSTMKQQMQMARIDYISITSIACIIILIISFIMKISLSTQNTKDSYFLYLNLTNICVIIIMLVVFLVSTFDIGSVRNEYLWIYNNPECLTLIDHDNIVLFDTNLSTSYSLGVANSMLTVLLLILTVIDLLFSYCYDVNDVKSRKVSGNSDESKSLLEQEKNLSEGKNSQYGKSKSNKNSEVEMSNVKNENDYNF